MSPGDWVTPTWDDNRYKGEPTAVVLEWPVDSHYPETQVRIRDLYTGDILTAPARDFRVVKTIEERMAEELMG